ncbi:MAG: hypothetical protein HY245_12400 [Rhizobiales bacterium]|nr:hypothetical protein [Hyphomicrobiales bacterium]MBI3674190.1 hypothetical protein [Hyphomicrobiales bacterium]
MPRTSLHAEIDKLRQEIEALHRKASPEVTAAAAPPPPGEAGLEGQVAELGRLVQSMLESAEETVADHPVATVAGALALGMVIGRLSAR